MQVSKINSNTFKGLLTITGPDKDCNITLNTDNVVAFSNSDYVDKKEDFSLGMTYKKGAVITLSSGANINTYMPLVAVVEAYKKASSTGEAQLKTQFNPTFMTKLL